MSLQILYAWDQSGRLVQPEEGHSGQRYTCLECGGELFWRQQYKRLGSPVRAHFSHMSPGAGVCTGESVEHRAAKQRLREAICNPVQPFVLVQRCSRLGCAETYEERLRFEGFTAEEEVRRDGYRLDVMAYNAAGEPVAGFEVHQTHRVSSEKVQALTVRWIELEAEQVVKDPYVLHPLIDPPADDEAQSLKRLHRRLLDDQESGPLANDLATQVERLFSAQVQQTDFRSPWRCSGCEQQYADRERRIDAWRHRHEQRLAHEAAERKRRSDARELLEAQRKARAEARPEQSEERISAARAARLEAESRRKSRFARGARPRRHLLQAADDRHGRFMALRDLSFFEPGLEQQREFFGVALQHALTDRELELFASEDAVLLTHWALEALGPCAPELLRLLRRRFDAQLLSGPCAGCGAPVVRVGSARHRALDRCSPQLRARLSHCACGAPSASARGRPLRPQALLAWGRALGIPDRTPPSEPPLSRLF